MSILTLVLNGHALSQICSKPFTFLLLTFAYFGTSSAFEQTVSKADVTRAEKYSIDAIRGASELPNSEPLLKIRKPLHWVLKNDGKVLVVPITIKYAHLTNSYCRLIAITEDFQRLALVQIPSEANFENCKSISTVFYFDINGDKRIGIVQGLDIKSNRYEAIVTVPIVYISHEASEGGYCYSDLASRQLTAADLVSQARTESTLQKARQRLRISKYECSK